MIFFRSMGRVLLVVFLLCGFVSGAQPFTNCGFEIVTGAPIPPDTAVTLNPGDDWLPGWSAGGPSGTVSVQNGYAGEYFFGELDGLAPWEGDQWVIFPDDSLGGSLSQTFSTIVGDYCTVSFFSGYVYSAIDSSDPLLGATVQASDGTVLSNNVYSPGYRQWSEFQLSFVATTSTTILTFSDASTVAQAVDLGLDDVTVNTEPPSWPFIIISPLSQTNAFGAQVNFTATAGGIPSSVQWYLGTNTVAGATNTSLTVIASETTAGSYTAVFSNAVGTNTTMPAVLTVLQIDTSPQSETANAGDEVTFTASVDLGGTTNQWYFNGYLIPGATRPTLSVTAGNQTAGTYTVLFGLSNITTTSSAALLTVSNIPFVNGSFEYLSGEEITPGSAEEGELGDFWLTGWDFGGTGSEVFVFNGLFLGLTAADGNQWVIFDSQTAPPPGVIWQTFSTAAGTNYLVTFETMAIYYDGTPSKSLTATAAATGGSLLALNTVTPGAEWATNQMAFTAQSINTTIAFTDSSAPNFGPSVALDAVAVSIPANNGGTVTNASLVALHFDRGSAFFVVQLSGQAGQSYVMETSTNLSVWLPVSTNVLAGTSVSVTNAVIPGATQQYWRAVPSP